MFRGKKEKKSHVALGLVELKGDDVTMTELEKKNTILSDGFFPPSLTSRKSRFRVSSVCPSGAASRWNCFATGGNLSYRRSSNHHGISVLRCLLFRVNGHPSFHPEFGIPSRSFVDCFFRWITLLSLLTSSRVTLHCVILEKINKNEWCMNGISQQVLKCRYYIYRIGSIVVVNK